MITHREAEALISARLDQPLDPITERALSAHLATCAECRAFARSSNMLATGLRELPYLPASSAVSRRVMARVDEGRSPWTKLGGLLNSNPGPAFSTFAVIAVLFLLGFFVLNRFVLDSGDGSDQGNNQLASQPTAPPTQSADFTFAGTAEPTSEAVATEEPTATTAPTDAPTETVAPTDAPTDAPEPTATEAPAPTDVPTAPPTDAPTAELTATEETTSLQQATGDGSTPDDIVDLTTAEAGESPEATATPYEEPSATVAPEPTATDIPEPTATPVPTDEPTETPEPTATLEPTAAPTATPEPTIEEAPPIMPIEGAEVIDAPEDTDATTTAEAGAGTTSEPEPTPSPTAEDVAIEPIGGTNNEQDGPSDGTGGQTIEPTGDNAIASTPDDGDEVEVIDAETAEATAEPTATEEAAPDDVIDLSSSSESYGNIAGERGGRLILDGGRMEYGAQAHPVVTTSVSGLEAQTVQAESGQAVAICAPGGDCLDLSSASSEGAMIDEPLGWIDGGLVYSRTMGDVIAYRYLVPTEDGSDVVSDELLVDGGTGLAPTSPAYQAEGRIWVITAGGDWLALSPGGAQDLPSGYGAPHDLRFAETGNRGLLVGYVSNGQLIIAPGEQPGSPILILPFSGADFDIAPGGNQVVVSTGAAIQVYDLDGTLVTTYASDGMQPGTVLWLNSGIVFVDNASGALLQIPAP